MSLGRATNFESEVLGFEYFFPFLLINTFKGLNRDQRYPPSWH